MGLLTFLFSSADKERDDKQDVKDYDMNDYYDRDDDYNPYHNEPDGLPPFRASAYL